MNLPFKKRKPVKSVIDKTRILDTNSPFMIKETYKSLRTNLMFALQNNHEGGKVIVFSSAIPSEGKTTVCLNTAITFAQTGAKVLIVDSDLRIPKLHKYLGVDGKRGFSNVLGGFLEWKDVVSHIEDYNIDCIAGGHIPPNPAELLSSKTTTNVISELKQNYDYIFIDTPPVSIVTDAIAIASLASGVVLVTRENYTPHTAIKDVLNSFQFANIKLLGMINNCSMLSEFSYKNPYGSKHRLIKYRSSYYSKYSSYYGNYYAYGAKSLEDNKE